MKPSTKLHLLFISCYLSCTMIWFYGLYYFGALESVHEILMLLLQPRVLVFIPVFIGGVLFILHRMNGGIDRYLKHPAEAGRAAANRAVVRIPKFFVLSIILYAIIGPQVVALNQDFLTQREYIFSISYAAPIVFVFSIPFLSGIVITVENWAKGIPVDPAFKAISLRWKLVSTVFVTSVGVMILLFIVNVNLVADAGGDLQIHAVLVKNIAALLFCLAAVLINLFVLFRQILRPVHLLQVEINKLVESGGNLNQEIEISVRDEIGDLGRSFNRFLGGFKEIIANTQQGAVRLMETSTEVSEASERTTSGATQIGQAMDQIAAGARSQEQGLSDTSKAMEELTRGIQRIVESATSVSSTSSNLTEASAEGQVGLNQVVSQMHRIEESVQQTGEVIGELGRQSTRIGDILLVISEISNQINLLSLNASIEAARAGEHGKGFAVVANEIKKLANRSNESAKEITDIVSLLQTHARLAVEEMDKGTLEVRKGREVVQQAGDHFDSILHNVQSVNGEIEEVSAAVEEMSASSEEILATIADLNQLAQSFSRHTEQVAASAGEQKDAMGDIQDAAQNLLRLSQELHVLTNKFQV